MTTKLQTKQSGHADIDAVFDPYVEGTSPPATGLNVGGTTTDINTRYAPISYGTAAPATGLLTKQSGHADINTLFAAYGTAIYALPINGNSYTKSGGRGSSTLSFNMVSDGTYSIVSNQGFGGSAVLDSGTWLPSGASVSDFSCIFATTMNSGPDPGGGSNNVTNNASTISPLTTTRTLTGGSSAITTGTDAYNSGGVTMKLYKLGELTNTTSVDFTTSSAG